MKRRTKRVNFYLQIESEIKSAIKMINTKAQEDKKVETLLTKAQVNIIDLAHCGE